jgi:hypothetical protein
MIVLIQAVRMLKGRLIGPSIGSALSLWAAFIFLRGSITGAPPLYSKGLFQRTLHFVAGIIFAALAVSAIMMIVRKK